MLALSASAFVLLNAGTALGGQAETAAHRGRSRPRDLGRVQLCERDPRTRVHPRSRRRPGRRRRLRPGLDRHHPARRDEPGDEGPGDHRPEPVLHLARARQRVAVHPHDGGRQPRPLPALLRQLLRAPRLRGDPGRRGRHRVLDRLPAARRAGRPRRVQGGDRLADGPHAGLRQGRQRGRRDLGQRQERDDRQVVRRHLRQRRRLDRRRRPDDDRPDLGDLRLVRLLADGRDPLQHPLPGLPLRRDHGEPGRHPARRRAARQQREMRSSRAPR